MLTDRLKQLKIEIQDKAETSSLEKEVLTILNHMDDLEEIIAFSKSKRTTARGELFEMIIKPQGNVCKICGRTL